MRATLGCCAVAGWAEAEQAGRSAGELGRSEVRRWLAGREAVRWAERERGRRAGAGLRRGRRWEWAGVRLGWVLGWVRVWVFF